MRVGHSEFTPGISVFAITLNVSRWQEKQVRKGSLKIRPRRHRQIFPSTHRRSRSIAKEIEGEIRQ